MPQDLIDFVIQSGLINTIAFMLMAIGTVIILIIGLSEPTVGPTEPRASQARRKLR
jgi:hypothetical protein